MKISVIIPVYNHDQFIGRCLDSVCNQTYHDLEIIVINDGSTDNTSIILKEFASKDNRVRVIEQPNQGTHKARVHGINLSTGDAIINLDSDDYLEKEAVSFLARKMISEDADLVVCDFVMHRNYRKTIHYNEIPESYNQYQALQYFLMGRLQVHLWGRLYKRKLLQGIEMPYDRVFTEDVLTNLNILCQHSLKFAKVDLALWHYWIHNKNASYSKNTQAVEGFFREFEYAERIIPDALKKELKVELALYKSKNWIVYCRKGGSLSRDKLFHQSFYQKNYPVARPLLAWYLRLEMLAYRQSLWLGRIIFLIMKNGKLILSYPKSLTRLATLF